MPQGVSAEQVTGGKRTPSDFIIEIVLLEDLFEVEVRQIVVEVYDARIFRGLGQGDFLFGAAVEIILVRLAHVSFR